MMSLICTRIAAGYNLRDPRRIPCLTASHLLHLVLGIVAKLCNNIAIVFIFVIGLFSAGLVFTMHFEFVDNDISLFFRRLHDIFEVVL